MNRKRVYDECFGHSSGFQSIFSCSPCCDSLVCDVEAALVFRSMKMEVPKFDRSDPNGWIFRIEEFFDFHGTPYHLCLRIVSFHMEGRGAA